MMVWKAGNKLKKLLIDVHLGELDIELNFLEAGTEYEVTYYKDTPLDPIVKPIRKLTRGRKAQ